MGSRERGSDVDFLRVIQQIDLYQGVGLSGDRLPETYVVIELGQSSFEAW